MKRLIFLLLLFAAPAWATDFPAASCSYADVNTAVGMTSAGDSVTIPSCTQTNWASKLTIGCITLQGTGDALGAGAHTIIGDNASSTLIAVSCNSPNKFRVRNFEIVGVGATHFSGQITVTGTASDFRIDHMKFTSQRSKAIVFGSDSCLQGVIDHNEFNGSFKIGVEVHHGGCNGGVNGNGPWATASDFSGALTSYVVIEDNTFNDSFAGTGPGCIDGFDGMRAIFRHNTCKDLTGHGTDSSGIRRGQRIFIAHDNTFVPTTANADSGIIFRGGTGLVYSNTFSKPSGSLYYKNNPVKLQNFRDNDSFSPFGVCAGFGSYDQNDAGNPFVTGTATAGSVAGTLEDTTKNFLTACAGGNCGTGDYSVRNVTQNWGAAIGSATATTVTNVNSAFGQSRAWTSGDSYEINSAYPCIDQVGRGAGDTLSGSPPTPTGWPNEVLEPVYSFNNTNENNSAAKEARGATIHINSGRDFLNEVSGFDGTAGVGVGTIAARPATCTFAGATNALVGYWATDENKFYQCTATNTWTLYYTEGTYPYCVNGVGPGSGVGCDLGAPPAGGNATLNQSALNFGNVRPGDTVGSNPASITLLNDGLGTLNIVSIAITGGDSPSPFAVSDNCGASLAPSASCAITITFTPRKAGVVGQATLTVDTDANDPTATLDGTGLTIPSRPRRGT